MDRLVSLDKWTASLIVVVILVAFSVVPRLLERVDPKVPNAGLGTGLFAIQSATNNSRSQFAGWLADGYKRFKGHVFVVRYFWHWNYAITGDALINELSKVPDSTFSPEESVNVTMNAHFTMGSTFREDGQLITSVVKSRFIRSLPELFPAIADELLLTLREELDKVIADDGWTSVSVVPHIMNTVCRASNRIVVGTPLCREPDYVRLNVQYTIDLFTTAEIMKLFVWPLNLIVGKYFAPLRRSLALARRLTTGIIEERRRTMEQHAADGKKDWEGKPFDFLQWFIEHPDAKTMSTERIMVLLLRLNFGAIHTTALSFIFTLYNVAARSYVQDALRAEAHEVLSQYGWTKDAMDNLHRADSVLREAQRVHSLGTISMTRLALHDYTFGDGTTVPRGSLVSVPARAIHLDPELYPNPNVFEPWRFYVDPDSSAATSKERKEYTTIGTDFMQFGLGRHACPGRFWSVLEMKAMLAFFVLNFDFKLDGLDDVPAPIPSGAGAYPDPSVKLLMRRREGVVSY